MFLFILYQHFWPLNELIGTVKTLSTNFTSLFIFVATKGKCTAIPTLMAECFISPERYSFDLLAVNVQFKKVKMKKKLKVSNLTQHLRSPPFLLQCSSRGDVLSRDLHSFAHLEASRPRSIVTGYIIKEQKLVWVQQFFFLNFP